MYYWPIVQKAFFPIQNTATPASLSTNYIFTPLSVQGGGTGLLITNKCKFTLLLHSTNYYTFEYHAIPVTAPIKAYVVVIYHAPDQLDSFMDELDTLL